MHFPLSSCQNLFPPTFSMVHLLHRLHGVDAPVVKQNLVGIDAEISAIMLSACRLGVNVMQRRAHYDAIQQTGST